MRSWVLISDVASLPLQFQGCHALEGETTWEADVPTMRPRSIGSAQRLSEVHNTHAVIRDRVGFRPTVPTYNDGETPGDVRSIVF